MKKKYIFGRLKAINLDNDHERIHETLETQDLVQNGPVNKKYTKSDTRSQELRILEGHTYDGGPPHDKWD